ncbi:MAG: hypothetical protein EXQ71_04260 [Acidimicrobiia bacterium]|nr:hypothetical protein [Acidimicrobiia bacterium]
MSAPTTTPGPIERSDLEAKFRELRGGVNHTRQSATNTLVTVGIVVAAGVLAAVFLWGRRKGRGRATVVEVRRI